MWCGDSERHSCGSAIYMQLCNKGIIGGCYECADLALNIVLYLAQDQHLVRNMMSLQLEGWGGGGGGCTVKFIGCLPTQLIYAKCGGWFNLGKQTLASTKTFPTNLAASTDWSELQ